VAADSVTEWAPAVASLALRKSTRRTAALWFQNGHVGHTRTSRIQAGSSREGPRSATDWGR
jgi:hypothetical protein